jgi:hypothetical protein
MGRRIFRDGSHSVKKSISKVLPRLSRSARRCRAQTLIVTPLLTICEELSRIFVNIVDLIEARRLGREPTIFPSRSALRQYSRETGKIFNKRRAKANGYLTALLIVMF